MLKIIILSLFLFASYGQTSEWEKINDEDDVQVYKKVTEGSPLVEFKGEGPVNADLAKVASVIFDCTRSPEWADSLAESKLDRWINKTQWIEYDHMNAPFFISDRDFVTQGSGQTHADGFDILFTYKSVSDPKFPESKYIRGNIIKATTGVRSTKEGSYVVMEAQVDPNGSIPYWIVNLVQKNWALKTFRNLRRQVQKKDIVTDPFVKQLLDKTTTENK
jgi:hypothetical protein